MPSRVSFLVCPAAGGQAVPDDCSFLHLRFCDGRELGLAVDDSLQRPQIQHFTMFQYEKVLDQEPLISSDGEHDGSPPQRTKSRSAAARAATVCVIALPWVLLTMTSCWIMFQYSRRGPDSLLFPQMTYSEILN